MAGTYVERGRGITGLGWLFMGMIVFVLTIAAVGIVAGTHRRTLGNAVSHQPSAQTAQPARAAQPPPTQAAPPAQATPH